MPEETKCQKDVAECYLQKGVGKQSGKAYTKLCIEFSNGYTLEMFPNPEQIFILSQILPTVE